jgi:ABC-type Na+ efflux pump permease subunit
MSQDLTLAGRSAVASGRTAAPWWLIFKQECVEMWAGGRVLRFLALYAVLMSVTAYLLATNNDLKLVTMKASVVVAVTSTITFGLFMGLVIGAESISGERERATLEPLLLTPSGSRQIVLGKFLAALSPWPAAFVLSVPYLATLSHWDPVLWTALFWCAVLGSLLAVAFVGFGMLVSIWSDSSKVSLFICLLVYAGLLIPAQLPTEFLNSSGGVVVSAIDPLESASRLLTMVVDENRPLSQAWVYLVAPAVMTAVIVGVLFLHSARRVRLAAE